MCLADDALKPAPEPNPVYLIQPALADSRAGMDKGEGGLPFDNTTAAASGQDMTSGCKLLCVALIALGLAGCIAAPIEMTTQTETRLKAQAPVRFLLTFDDGPSASGWWNPTATVLDSLKSNPLQPNIKAVFFAQTRAPRGRRQRDRSQPDAS